MSEVLKFIGSLVTGGLAGALLNEWYRRKRDKLQKISLIERVNRPVDPKLQGGITLARFVGDSVLGKLVELKNLREYQLTLRNASTLHLQNAEIQFDFPAKNVQEYASPRTTLSETELVKVSTAPKDTTTAFRWLIPQFPSGDSVEFTFYAEDPSSEGYVAALYNVPSVIVEKVKGEPAPTKTVSSLKLVLPILAIAALVIAVVGLLPPLGGGPVDRLTVVKDAGCDLRIVSSYDRYEPDPYYPSNTRIIKNRIFNAGQSCVIKSDLLDPKGPFTIGAGDSITREGLAEARPRLAETEVYVGTTGAPLKKASVLLYIEP